MADRNVFEHGGGIVTVCGGREQSYRLERLCGMLCADDGPPEGPPPWTVATEHGPVWPESWRPAEQRLEADAISIRWQLAGTNLSLASHWRFARPQGVWQCTATIANQGDKPVILHRALARFGLAAGLYDVYTQSSQWCGENQGAWRSLDHGVIEIASLGGRTTEQATPYLCLRERTSQMALACHVAPRGDWVIRAQAIAASAGTRNNPTVVLEAGLSDRDLRLRLQPGESFDLPTVLLQPVPHGRPALAAPVLHAYAVEHLLPKRTRPVPLVYNTWFDAFEHLQPERLRRQLTAAREIGCEVFTIDAGWYGQGAGNWGLQTGDWREKLNGAFGGQMADFAAEVRAAGLGFGLWMEPERNAADTPAVKAHPEWFIRGAGGQYYPDLCQTEAYEHIRAEMARLTETYQLAWMKIDFNFALERDPAGRNRADYYAAWYRLLDDLQARYPDTFYEGCASGGLRLELGSLRHFPAHFLSDTVYPQNVLRIYQGALLRLPPGRFTLWAVLRGIGNTHLPYGAHPDQPPDSVITAVEATWRQGCLVDVDFAARIALLSMFGLSGDLASLPPAARRRLQHHAAFFKQWREFIYDAHAHLLTPVEPRENVDGWAAIQLQHPRRLANLLFVFRLDIGGERFIVRPRNLDPATRYIVRDDDTEQPGPLMTGDELMNQGLFVTMPACHTAKVFTIEPESF